MATATALDLIKSALKDLGVLGVGDVLSDEEAQDSLDKLNMMMESWSIARLTVYVESQLNFPYTGAQSYTIGTGGDFNTDRPLKLVSAFTRQNGIDYPMEILDSGKQYDMITNKGVGGAWPICVWYEQTFPLGTLWFYPISGSGDVFLRFWSPLQTYAGLTTQIALPTGYKRAIVSNLALELSATFRRDPTATLIKTARDSLSALRRYNLQPGTMSVEATAVSSRWRQGQYNILSDTP